MRSADDKIKKLRALMNDPAATASERAAARERIVAIKNPGRGMSDAELAATIARLKDANAPRSLSCTTSSVAALLINVVPLTAVHTDCMPTDQSEQTGKPYDWDG